MDKLVTNIAKNVLRQLNEGRYTYRGFKCVNISDNPSFPSYAIISPEGEQIETTQFPSDMKEIVDEYLSQGVKEHRSIRNRLKKLNEDVENGLFAEIRFVQGGDGDFNEIEQMFCGDEDGYCQANAQPVIDYLKQWDDEYNEITPERPRIARFDTSYADENGDYVLLYNSSVGGDFLLYRPANEQEIEWYRNNGGVTENRKKNLDTLISESIRKTLSKHLG